MHYGALSLSVVQRATERAAATEGCGGDGRSLRVQKPAGAESERAFRFVVSVCLVARSAAPRRLAVRFRTISSAD